MAATTTTAKESEASATLEPHERLETLCDRGTFRPLLTGTLSRRLDARRRSGDGVVVGAGSIDGRPLFCYVQDPSFMGGSLGEAHADSIVRVMHLAAQAAAPLVGFVESGGARLQEGHAALAGYGRIFRASVELSRRVPQISVVTGVSAGGGAYSPALTDFVLMTERARMFLTGPSVVAQALGEEVSMEELGAPAVHGRNGVCQMVVDSDRAAIRATRELLALLPQAIGSPAPLANPSGPPPEAPDASVPSAPRRVYDVRGVARALVDEGRLVELSPRWARNMVTALARIEGRSVGIVANQPRHLGGIIDADAAEKAAAFVELCDRFSTPLVVLVDTPGFMPGTRQEGAGVIRYGASLLRAFAGARVPKLTVVLRKAYGGAVITMNSKGLGADLVFAWPQAEIGIMNAAQAVGIIHRRDIEAAPDPIAARSELASSYAGQHLTADAAAADGFVDEVIEPGETRERLAWALFALGQQEAGLEALPARKAQPDWGPGP
jgi:acetyl-CoA carboxylase carboxyltransferase component